LLKPGSQCSTTRRSFARREVVLREGGGDLPYREKEPLRIRPLADANTI
jgi:hypothetical protein